MVNKSVFIPSMFSRVMDAIEATRGEDDKDTYYDVAAELVQELHQSDWPHAKDFLDGLQFMIKTLEQEGAWHTDDDAQVEQVMESPVERELRRNAEWEYAFSEASLQDISQPSEDGPMCRQSEHDFRREACCGDYSC